MSRGVAKGLIAIGDIAFGLIAIGGIAVGGISVGELGIGALSIGGLAIGIAGIGGAAVGLLAVGGMALGGWVGIGGRRSPVMSRWAASRRPDANELAVTALWTAPALGCVRRG